MGNHWGAAGSHVQWFLGHHSAAGGRQKLGLIKAIREAGIQSSGEGEPTKGEGEADAKRGVEGSGEGRTVEKSRGDS